MAVIQAELCSLDNFPSRLSFLDVLILKSNLNSILQHGTDTPTVLFIPQRYQVCNRTGILLRVHPITEVDISSCSGGGNSPNNESDCHLRLFTSRYFHRHHRLQQLETGTIRPLEPVNLDRVVLGARSRQSLRWAGAEQFTSGLLELCLSGEVVLARQGDPLLLPQHPLFGEDKRQVQQQLLDLLVLECSPVTQGKMTASTSLVLTDSWDSANPTPLPFPCSSPSLSVSDFAHYADGLGGTQSLLDTWRLLGPRLLDVQQVLDCRLDVRVVDTQLWHRVKCQQEAAVDVDSCVFVSKQQLLRLGLFNHEWVMLSKPGRSSRTSTRELDVKPCISRERLVSVVVVVDLTLSPELQIHDNVGFVSATLWFNMTEGEMIPMKKCALRMKRWKPSLDHDCHRSNSFCCSASPSFASELHIQLIVSPLYNSLGCYDSLLAEHFSTPRVVSQGDILTVPAEHHPDLLEKHSEGISRCPVLYFRVQKVSPSAVEENKGAYLVDRTHTSLYLGVSTNSPVPFSVEEESLWSSLSPPGLNKTVDLISSIILPHLQHRSFLSSCTVLLHGPAGSGKTTVVRATNRRLNLHLLKVDCVTMCADSPAASEAKLTSVFQRADALQPCILLLRNLQLLLRARGAPEDNGRVPALLYQLLSNVAARVVVVATVCRAQDLSAGVVGAFVHQVKLESPTEEQRHSMLVSLSQELHLGRDVSLERLSKLTAGFVLGNLNMLLFEAGRSACRRLIHACGGRSQEDLCSSGVTILNQDFTCALETLQDIHSKAIGAPKIPNVRWEDVGGLENIKKEILDTVQLPLQRPELLSLGLNRTGVLLYGPPGTGKTLLAKAVATECSMTFLSVKGPELINMYVGQSEENIREVFHRARSAAPCVVFFDELDSLAPNRGCSGDSGGVMDRVVSQLLAELDTLHSSAGVFVIGATNRPDLLDQSLLRPGRFDKLVYVGINEDRVSQLQVLQAILRKFQLDPAVKLQDIVNHCPSHMSGADLYALCSDAMTAAIKRKICFINDGLDSEDSPVLLSTEDFSAALENFKPSVSDKELLRYQNIRQRFSAK